MSRRTTLLGAAGRQRVFPPVGGQFPVALTAIDGEVISGTSQSNFQGNGYYTRKGFTRAANWVGPKPDGGNYAGWDDPNFIPIGSYLDFDSGDTNFYARMNDLGLNSMMPAADSISLANQVTYGKATIVDGAVHPGGSISSTHDPAVIAVQTGEEPADSVMYNEHMAAQAAWLASADGPGRFSFYNHDHSLINSEVGGDGGTYFSDELMVGSDFMACDIYWFAGATGAASIPSKLHQQLYPTAPFNSLPGQGTQAQCARGCHYGSVMDAMRKHLNSSTTRPCLTWVENGAPFLDATSMAITPAQMKWAVWATLVHGARGILYFNHTFREGDPGTHNVFNTNSYGGPGITGTGIYAAAKEVNRRALQIAPVINAPFDGYFVYGDLATSGLIARSGFLTAVTSTNARTRLSGVDACCKWLPTEGKHYILSTTREQDGTTNWPVTFRMVDQGQTLAVPVFGGSNIAISRGGAIPAGFCEFSDTFATAADYKCYRIDGGSA